MINFACILESSLWHHWWHLLRIGTIGVERSWLQNGPWGINSYKVLPVPKRNSKLSSSCIAKDGKEATQQSKCAQLLWLGTHLSQCWSLALQASSCWLQIEHWDLWGKPGAFWQVSWEILGTWSIWEKLIGGLVLVHKVGSSRGCSECHHSDSNSDVGVWQGSKSWKLQVLQTASPHNCLTSGPSARPPLLRSCDHSCVPLLAGASMPFKGSLDALAEYTEDCAWANGREQQHATTVALHDNFCEFQRVCDQVSCPRHPWNLQPFWWTRKGNLWCGIPHRIFWLWFGSVYSVFKRKNN